MGFPEYGKLVLQSLESVEAGKYRVVSTDIRKGLIIFFHTLLILPYSTF